jgi:hypothetical protein
MGMMTCAFFETERDTEKQNGALLRLDISNKSPIKWIHNDERSFAFFELLLRRCCILFTKKTKFQNNKQSQKS